MSYGLKDLAKDALTLNVELVSERISTARYALCNVCPHRRENIPGYKEKFEAKVHATPWSVEKDKCNLCGCYMPAKVKLLKATCPTKKW